MATDDALEAVWRAEAPHVLAALVRRYGGFADCEDAVQEALLAAARTWPVDGLPDRPRAWLVRAASRRLVDQWRSDVARRRREEDDARLGAATPPEASGVDDTLELLLLCCHPALSLGSQVALTARAVAGLTTAQVAAGFLVTEPAMAQRISRAKRTLAEHGARFGEVGPAERTARTGAVRTAISLLHTEGHTRSSGEALTGPELSAEAVRLARAVLAADPGDPENAGLLALLLLTGARTAARADPAGDLVPLEHQDRSRWDRAAVAEGVALLEKALPVGPVGPFQLQAAIAAVHDEAPTWEATDWPQVLALYRLLDAVAPGEPVTLGLATAVAMVDGPAAGLALLDGRPGTGRHHRRDAVRGHLLALAGRPGEAVVHLREAARTTRSLPEQRYLNREVARLEADG